MLVYHPAFDLHHCIFRMVCLLNRLPPGRHHVERIRILDFYLLFPAQILEMRFPRSLLKKRKSFKKLINRFECLSDKYQLFLRLEPFQVEALGCLASHNLISADALGEGYVERSGIDFPDQLKKVIVQADARHSELIELLTGPLMEVPLYGHDGLRGRTELFEYHYDAT